MTVAWTNLDSDEQVLWEGQPRLKSIIPAVVIGVPMIAFAGLGLLVIAAAYLNVKHTSFLITNEGLYRKTGILSRSVQKIGFDKVQNISFSQGILGNYFGYGNIEVSTAGGSGIEMSFNSINNPRKVESIINNKLKKAQNQSDGEEHGNGVEKELVKIRKLLEEINDKV